MINVAYVMGRDEREAVANYLGVQRPDPPVPAKAYCSDRTVNIGTSPNPSWKGWGPDETNTRYARAGGLTLTQVGKLKLKWAYGFDGDISAFGAPTVLGGTIFIGSAGGAVQALSTESGCVKWLYQSSGPVRSGPVAVPNGKTHVLVFSDLTGWVYGLEAETGRQLWKKKVETHDTARLSGTAAVDNGIVFVPAASWEETRSSNSEYSCCTFRGSVTALRAKDGTQVWKTYTIREQPRQMEKSSGGVGTWGPSGAGVWSSPTLDRKRGLLYVTTGDNFSSPPTDMSDAVLAMDIKTGRIVWSRQMSTGDIFSGACTGTTCPGPDFDFGSSVLIEKLPNGKDVLLAGQKSGVVLCAGSRTRRAKFCGRCGSAKAAPTAACSGAWRAMGRKSMPRFPIWCEKLSEYRRPGGTAARSHTRRRADRPEGRERRESLVRGARSRAGPSPYAVRRSRRP